MSGALLKNVLLVGMQVGGGDRSDREEVEKPCTSGELWGEGVRDYQCVMLCPY